MFVWAAERVPADEVEAWEAGLDAALPGESAAVADAVFDDSYDQINQQ